MIYILFMAFLVIAFFAGMYVYRIGVNDGMRRMFGASELKPLFEKKQPEIPNAELDLMTRINNYTGKAAKK